MPNRNGFTIIDNSDPEAGIVKHNPKFTPQNYANVPPPLSFETVRGRGRGRGGFGGAYRDDSGRGRGG